ncbi:MAG TPA: putative lipid II flippase FtsW [Acidimicrobiales bacterium]|jgi:cell division protein FtsW|nr:putative lipid II flippase FtsW [Acidimicrobiales bacterium]
MTTTLRPPGGGKRGRGRGRPGGGGGDGGAGDGWPGDDAFDDDADVRPEGDDGRDGEWIGDAWLGGDLIEGPGVDGPATQDDDASAAAAVGAVGARRGPRWRRGRGRDGDGDGERARSSRGQGVQNPMFLGIAFLVAVFNLLGLVMVLSASSVVALDKHGSSWYFVSRQLTWSIAGTGVLVLVARIDYRRWRRLANPLLWVSIAALVLVLVPGIGVSANGAQRWLGVGSLTIQPAEVVKLTLLIWIADLLARRAKWMSNTRATLRPVVVVLVLVAVLVMLQPNLGTTIVIAGIALSVCFVAGVPLAPMARWAGVALVTAAVLALAAPYRRTRVFGFLDPWSDPLDQGYQSIQSLVGLASGGFAGTGLGASRAKWGFLPFAHTDFIFAIIGEELGLVGALVVVALFVLLGVLGIRIALHAPDRFGMLLAVGITAWFLLQAFVNIGAVIGVLPVTGVPLPFVSFGGSSLVFSMAGAGLLLAVARRAVSPASRGDSLGTRSSAAQSKVGV